MVWWHVNNRGLSNTKAVFVEEQQWYFLNYIWEDRGVHAFSKGINPKENVIALVEFELAYFEAGV